MGSVHCCRWSVVDTDLSFELVAEIQGQRRWDEIVLGRRDVPAEERVDQVSKRTEAVGAGRGRVQAFR
jgi:hypothetical protein